VLLVAGVPSVTASPERGHPETPLDDLGAPDEGQYRFSHPEKCFMRKINHRRANHGLRKLRWDPQLGYVARRHASAMAESGYVAHDERIGQRITNWRRLGQNTGRGRPCRPLFKSFWHSPKHRANFLGKWRHFGVGTEWSGGTLYVQQIFESRADPGNIYNYPSGG
jgi:uncharacterized protein YkwD